MSSLLCGAGAALSLLAAPLALADEFDWLYFPMYTGDTAHAVHLKGLKFRPDGLLEAASRTPRWRDDWTGPESAKGWYNYRERLIDCETGYRVETAHSLLDQDGNPLGTRAETRAEQVTDLKRQLEEEKSWPERSDIFLACAAASNTAFQKQRAAAAAKVQPLYSHRALVEVLGADTEALYSVTETRFDFERYGKKLAAPAASLFHDMRAHAISQRKAFNAAHLPAPADSPRDAALLAQLVRQLADDGVENLTVDQINGDLVEYSYPAEDEAQYSRRPAAQAWEKSYADCAYGISLPVSRKKGRGGHAALQVRAVVRDAARRGQSADGMDELAAAVCKQIATVRAASAAPPAALDLNKLVTPEAMLLALRATRRSAR